MQIEHVEISRLNPAPYNPRHISDEMLAKLSAGLDEFGFVQPVVANRRTGTVVGGHQRIKAAEKRGDTTVPVFWVDLDEGREKALNLALNKISGEWDDEMLMRLLAEMDDADLQLTGFLDDELAEMMAQFEAANADFYTDEDDVPPVEPECVSRPGDIWILGNHRLMCGDSTRIDQMEQLTDGHSVDMVFTDPPYNVDYEGAAGKIKNDSMADAEFRQLLLDMFTAAHAVMAPGAPIYVAHADGGEIGLSFRTSFLSAGFKLAACLIWKKNQFTLSRSDYQWIHEPILYGWKQGAAHKWYGGRAQTSIAQVDGSRFCRTGENEWSIQSGDEILRITGDNIMVEVTASTITSEDKPKKSELHPTMKPVRLVERFIENSSRASQKVLDICGGSGSTLIACEKSGRHARVMELDEKFADVIIRRWQQFTRCQAKHIDGRLFDEIQSYVRESEVVD